MEHPNKRYFEAVAKAIPAEQYTTYNLALLELEERIAASGKEQEPEPRVKDPFQN